MNYLGLDDIVMIAAAVLDIEPEVLHRTSRINTADSAVHAPGATFGEIECHPGLVQKIGVLGYRLVRYHPFPDGNKRVAFLAMVDMAERNGAKWSEPPDDPEGDDTVEMMLAAAAGTVDEDGFIIWVGTRVT
ncbi:MAG: Fic family protein [Gemmatimonadetes bacterium]|nr:Fic family protein [Gemmatimonadota bacterium]